MKHDKSQATSIDSGFVRRFIGVKRTNGPCVEREREREQKKGRKHQVVCVLCDDLFK